MIIDECEYIYWNQDSLDEYHLLIQFYFREECVICTN